jgi:signal transduction histidine kinase
MNYSPAPMNLPTQNPTIHEDIVLEGLAQRVVADVNHFFSKERVERAAVLDERQRLARELHDGLLQSLTGAALKLHVLSHVVELNPRAARSQLREIVELITEQQRELRTWIENRLLATPAAIASAPDVRAALDKVCRRAEWQWGLCVDLTIDEKAAIPRELGDAIYRIVQEGLTNIGRHAGARRARVQLVTPRDRACVTISDDGVGFPFRGRFDLATLNQRNLGPESLKQRVASLRGDIVLTSTLSGSQLDISLPFGRRAWPGAADRTAAA